MEIKDMMDLCRLQGAVEAAVKYIIATSTYSLNKVVLLKMLDVGGVGYADEVKEDE